MSNIIDIGRVAQRAALDNWIEESKRRMALRFPLIDFYSNDWLIRKIYQTEQRDFYFTNALEDFSEKDASYIDALRCLVAEIIIAGKPRHISVPVAAFRLLVATPRHHLLDLSVGDLRELEARVLSDCRRAPPAANTGARSITSLSKLVVQLERKRVLPILGWRVQAATRTELRKISKCHFARIREDKCDRLERRLEAFNEAFNYMIDGSLELSSRDRVALCTGLLLLCAPSRINEVLCMSIDDYLTVNDYAQRDHADTEDLHEAHQMLIITMKGSKGAEWSPKPALKFMIDAFHYAMDVIKEHGKRSRMLVEWYQKNPNKLYLPPELEYLRGRDVTRNDLAKIVKLDANVSRENLTGTEQDYFNEVRDRIFRGPNPEHDPSKPANGSNRATKDLLSWANIETLLLKKVHEALNRCRRVTTYNYYQGDLAKMLFLFDEDFLPPFLPSATTYSSIRRRFKSSERAREGTRQQTIFEKLDITIPVGGTIQFAEMDTHDPRRWLTTMALIHGEKLSDVLINKWANRSKLSQLKAYDFRTAESRAEAASMPEAQKLNELTDLSNGLAALERIEQQFGLQTTMATAHDAGVAATSLEAIAQAVENRPVAKTSRGIIIIYPQLFGACLHQHHEKPCRNYSNELSASCLTCHEGVQQKGHLPTNDAVRDVNKKLFDIIVCHLKNLALTHNRNVADDPAMLGEHMLTLVEKGLSPMDTEQLACTLIDDFHRINNLLKDRRLANLLEQALVARESVKILDDPTKNSGAIFKYHNPMSHAEPLIEIALDEHGGREQVAREEKALVAKYPQFAPALSRMIDERHLVAPDGNEEE